MTKIKIKKYKCSGKIFQVAEKNNGCLKPTVLIKTLKTKQNKNGIQVGEEYAKTVYSDEEKYN